MSLWDDVCDAVQRHVQHPDLQAALENGAYLFEKVRLSRTGAAMDPEEQGWTPEVVLEPIDMLAVERLKQAVMSFVRVRPNDPSVVSATWALGKLGDQALKPFFVEMLGRYVNEDPDVMFQVMVALDDLGEDVFGGSQSRSIRATEENGLLAKAYLDRRVGGESGSNE